MTIIDLHSQKKLVLDWMLILLWVASFLILLFSFYQQYGVKIESCTLCKWQRYIYFLIFSLSPIGLIQRYNLSIRYALIFVFFIGLCLATYHTLVQFGWLADRCEITQKIENMNDFMKMLEHPKAPCANVSWKLFGLSASIYNIIFSFFALVSLNFNNIKRLIHER